MGKGKFYYSFDDETYHGEFDNEDEAVEEALADNDDEVIYVGIGDPKDASEYVDVDDLLERISEVAYNQCGEVAEEYLMHWSEEEKDVLQKMICDHLNKVDPVTFCNVKTTATFRVVDGKAVRETDS